MSIEINEQFYTDVPLKQKKDLIQFRKNHFYKSLKHNGYKWEYIRAGKNKDVVLLLTGGSRIGESYAILPHLEKDFTIISPTYPIVYSIEEMVEGINQILTSENVNKCYLLGTSLGGMIAQEFVRRFPNKIIKLIIANTMPPLNSKSYNFRRNLIIPFLYLLPKYIVKKITRNNFDKMYEETKEQEKLFWKAYTEELLETCMSKKWIIAQFKLAHDFSNKHPFTPNDLENWKGRMLIINSENDTTFDSKIQEKLLRLYPKAKVITLTEAGHIPILLKKEEYIANILNFLKS